MKTEYENVDAICLVLANERSKAVIDAVLNFFLGMWETLSADQFENLVFHSEEEMLNFFIENDVEDQLFVWGGNPPNVKVGAHLCSDGSLVMSVIRNADGNSEFETLRELKAVLKSETGGINYSVFPEFNGKSEFIALLPELACHR